MVGWSIETVNDLLLWAHVEFGLWVLGAGCGGGYWTVKRGYIPVTFYSMYMYSKYFLAPIQGV